MLASSSWVGELLPQTTYGPSSSDLDTSTEVIAELSLTLLLLVPAYGKG